MTSTRSYRGALSMEAVRDEIVKGLDTQFDYKYAAIMLRLIDTGAVEELLAEHS